MYDRSEHDGSLDHLDSNTQAEIASRRSFVRRSVMGAAAAAPALLLASTAQAGSPRKKARTSIHPSATTTTTTTSSALPELYTGQNKAFFGKIRDDENYHYTFLMQALGSAARPLPYFINLNQADVKSFATLAAAFENTGVSAYLGAAPYIQNPNYLIAAAQISQIEAYHSGYLNALTNATLTPNNEPFTNVLPLATIQAAVMPYIGSLNGGPAPSFSTTPSATNDIAILNFALLLEFLEAAYYNANVPVFFPGAV